MGGNRKVLQQHVARPSPLQQVHSPRTLSQVSATSESSTSESVRDPEFWKRFSTAMHMAEAKNDEEKGPTSSVLPKNEWLAQQHREKRRCRIMCASITCVVIMVIVAAAVIGYYFTKIHK